jgi:hypothetical protein
VRRILVAALFVLSVSSACASNPAPPPKPPLVDAETQLTTPRRKPYDPPRIVAPPPAYGNKIVMAGKPPAAL